MAIQNKWIQTVLFLEKYLNTEPDLLYITFNLVFVLKTHVDNIVKRDDEKSGIDSKMPSMRTTPKSNRRQLADVVVYMLSYMPRQSLKNHIDFVWRYFPWNDYKIVSLRVYKWQIAQGVPSINVL